MCCPTSDGAACAVVCSEAFVKAHKLENQAIEIVSQGMATDSTRLFEDRSSIELAGSDMTRMAAKEAFTKAKIGPEDVQVIELHDCCERPGPIFVHQSRGADSASTHMTVAANELLVYDALGLAPPGKAHEIVEKKDNTYGGKWVINASGGLLAKGHPLGTHCPPLSRISLRYVDD